MKNPDFNKTQEVVMVNPRTEQPADTFRHVKKIIDNNSELREELKQKSEQLHDFLLDYTDVFETSNEILNDFIIAYKINLVRAWTIKKTSGPNRITEVDTLISQL